MKRLRQPFFLIVFSALLLSCDIIVEPKSTGKYYINNQTNSDLQVQAFSDVDKVDLIDNQIPAHSEVHIYTAIEASGGHVLPSNFFTDFVVNQGTDTLYQGINNEDWEIVESTADFQKLVLTISEEN